MKQKFYINPESNHTDWSKEETARFITYAVEVIQKKDLDYCLPNRLKEGTLLDLYLEGRAFEMLGCLYSDFVKAIKWKLENHIWSKAPFPFQRSYRRNSYWYKNPNSRFVKGSHHQKKELSIEEINRREWKKKVNRNKSLYLNRGPKVYFQRIGHRKTRRFVKKCIKSGEWSKIKRTLKCEFYDVWDWD